MIMPAPPGSTESARLGVASRRSASSRVAARRGGARFLGAGRLRPPPNPAVPGAYDYARTAWFDGIGATGRGFAPIRVIAGGGTAAEAGLRVRLSQHIQAQAGGGGAGGIA